MHYFGYKKYKNILFILPFMTFLFGYVITSKFLQPKVFSTPSIVGKKLLQAVSILSDHNLNIRFLDYKLDPDLPHGTIISQRPIAGRQIKSYQAVYVVVAKKPHKIACPSVIGKHKNAITQSLKDANIQNKNYYVPSNHPQDHCVAQYPSPNRLLKKNSIITYLAQSPKKPVLLPDFRGKKLSQVLHFLENHKHITAEVVHAGSHTYTLTHSASPAHSRKHARSYSPLPHDTKTHSEHIICDQRPLAGSIVTLDDNTQLVVHLQVVPKESV